MKTNIKYYLSTLITAILLSANVTLNAQIITTLNDSLSTSLRFKRPDITGAGNQSLSAWASQDSLFNYVAEKITITVAGNYTFKTDSTLFSGCQDPMLFLYDNNFDPSVPLAHGIVANDDTVSGVSSKCKQSCINNVKLSAGTYTLVVTVWNIGVAGRVYYKFSGPAAVGVTSKLSLSSIEDSVQVFTSGNKTASNITTSLTASCNTNLTGATIQITSNYKSKEDILSFTNQNGITGTWNSSTGTLTLSGSSSADNYQTALRSITYKDTASNPSISIRTIGFSINAGTIKSSILTRKVSVIKQVANPAFINLTSSSYKVAWTTPNSGAYLVIRHAGSAPSFNPVDGTVYSVGAQDGGDIVYVGTSTDFSETGMSPNVDYYYTIYTYQTDNGAIYNKVSPLTGVNKIVDESATTAVDGAKTVVSSFNLNQNYPNPFNPTTTISYSVPKSQFVELRIYNLLGQVVTTLVNEHQNPGNYKVNFNASNLASGMYVYSLVASSDDGKSNFKSVKKMMLLK
jgi:hypothetical protein